MIILSQGRLKQVSQVEAHLNEIEHNSLKTDCKKCMLVVCKMLYDSRMVSKVGERSRDNVGGRQDEALPGRMGHFNWI